MDKGDSTLATHFHLKTKERWECAFVSYNNKACAVEHWRVGKQTHKACQPLNTKLKYVSRHSTLACNLMRCTLVNWM